MLLKAIGLAVIFAGVTTYYASHAYKYAKEVIVIINNDLNNRNQDK